MKRKQKMIYACSVKRIFKKYLLSFIFNGEHYYIAFAHLETSAGLCEPLSRIGLWEEDGGRDSVGSWLQAEAHGYEEIAPAASAASANLVLDALLGGVHGILAVSVDAL